MAPKMNRDVREKIVSDLIKRDGNRCAYPGCSKPFTKLDKPTVDHWLPWSVFQDNSFDNFRLMHQECNNKKGNLVPNADGTLPSRRTRQIKLPRPTVCETCISGRILLIGEVCSDCGTGPQPQKYPAAYKKKPKNCEHSGRNWCWLCCIGFIERRDKVVG